MEPLGAKLRRQRLRLGLTLDDLAGRAGISKPYLSLIETGRVPNPPSDEKLRRLEQSLGFTSGELVSQAHLYRTPRDVRAVLSQLLKGTDTAPADVADGDETNLSGMLHRLVGKSGGDIEQVATNAVPVINKVAGGYPTDFMDLSYPPRVADDYVGCPEIRDKDAFAARVAGDSMTPKYIEGNIVIFSPALSARDGDDCFVRFEDGQTTFRRVFFESGEKGEAMLRLQPRNEKYRAQIISSERVAGLHRAVFRYEAV
jgi:repressor LexA